MGEAITDYKARQIASEWHGGQGSALYKLASSGAIVDGAVQEVEQERRLVAHRLATNLDKLSIETRDLRALRGYIDRHGLRGPVEGWAALERSL